MEMAMVLAIIGILLRLATPGFRRVIIRSREAVLKSDLSALRESIDGYFADNRSYPQTLDVLVEKRYIRKLPLDPAVVRFQIVIPT